MEVLIYVSKRLPCGIDELEDALETALEGRGEVTGTGIGQAGSNIDVFIKDGVLSGEQALILIRQAILNFDLSKETKVVIDGSEHSLA